MECLITGGARDAMLRLFEDEALGPSLGVKAREAVYPKYDVTRLAAEMKAFYMNLVGQSASLRVV